VAISAIWSVNRAGWQDGANYGGKGDIARGELPASRVGTKIIRLDPADVERLLKPIPTVAAS